MLTIISIGRPTIYRSTTVLALMACSVAYYDATTTIVRFRVHTELEGMAMAISDPKARQWAFNSTRNRS